VPRLCEFYSGICLTTEEKSRKNLSQGKKNLSQIKKNLSQIKKNLSQIKKNLSQSRKTSVKEPKGSDERYLSDEIKATHLTKRHFQKMLLTHFQVTDCLCIYKHFTRFLLEILVLYPPET
jgi:NRPS condensation-like uncharacterized protein